MCAATIYRHSLAIALLALFAVSFMLHVVTGAAEFSAEQIAHGGAGVSPLGYLTTSRLWFESFQNWQSEFMSIGALVILAIFLREKGCPSPSRSMRRTPRRATRAAEMRRRSPQ